MGSVTHAMVSLVIETVKPALGRSVIPAIPYATNRTRHAKFLELILKGMAGLARATSSLSKWNTQTQL